MAFRELSRAYYYENSLAKQFIKSFDRFVEEGMQEIIAQQNIIEPQIEGISIKLGKVRV